VTKMSKTPLKNLETILSRSEGGFLTGKNPTIADLQIFFESTDEMFSGRTLDEYPSISAWSKKMMEIKEVKEVMD
jgi:glutathione S-transferase